MANLTYSTTLPQRKALIKSQQLRTLFTDLSTFANTFFPNVSGGAQYQSLLVNSGLTGFDLSHIIRSNVALEHDAGNGTANQALRSDGDGTTSWTHVFRSNVDLEHDAGNGSAGQVLQSDGDGTTSWTSVSGAPSTVQRSTSTTALSFVPVNTINVIDASAGSITHYLPDSPTSTQKLIKFLVDGVNSWEANNWTLNGNGNNIIVVNADGSVEAAAATVTISSNISFGVWFNGTQYVMERGI